jgi:hypothetical protein
MASLFGGLFLQDASGFWFLDSIAGSLEQICSSRAELQTTLDSEYGRNRFLMVQLATEAEEKGLKLGTNEIYDIDPPPVLGGTISVDYVIKIDFAVSLHMSGQIHQQFRSLPPGAVITEVAVDDHNNVTLITATNEPAPESESKSRWRRGRRA